MSTNLAEAMIPIVLFISIAFVFELTPEVIERLGTPPAAKNRDLRRGIISLAIGFGFIALGVAIPEEDALRPMLGVASFPVLLGFGFLLMHKLSPAN